MTEVGCNPSVGQAEAQPICLSLSQIEQLLALAKNQPGGVVQVMAPGADGTGHVLAGVPGRQPVALDLFGDRPWPKAREVGRYGDMNPDTHLRVGFDGDNDVYLSVWGTEGGADIEFCTGMGGGGQSPRTREALIALMLAMEADNATTPHKDWWARRMGQSGAKPI